MQIYTKYHDYYDVALKDFLAEKTPIYERTTRETRVFPNVALRGMQIARAYLTVEKRFRSQSQWGQVAVEERKLPYLETSLRVIGFCGKLYPVYSNDIPEGIAYKGTPRINIYRHLDPELYTEKRADFEGLIKKNEQTELLDGYNQLETSKELHKLFLELDTPCFLYDPRSGYDHSTKHQKTQVTVNPVLSRFDFHKVLGPWEAMQELNMYLGNTLVKNNTPPMPVGSDVIIAESKGFDKWSFRKHKDDNKK